MTISNDDRSKLLNIIYSLNELINGKFILADAKISKILKLVVECNELTNLLGECTLNFNYEKEFARAKIKTPTRPAYFKMPEEKYKILPMVFCILVDIDEHKIDFATFLKDYFRQPEFENDEYKCFTNNIIKPFRNAISELFDLPVIVNDTLYKSINKEDSQNQNNEENEAMEQANIDNMEFFEDVKQSIDLLISTVQFDKKIKFETKDDALIILNGIIKACNLQDTFLLNALITGFNFIVPEIKSIRFIYKDLQEKLFNYYLN